MKDNSFVLGIIGGSGIYDIDGVKNGEWVKYPTPYGDPSDEIFTGILNDIKVAFLPRHGRGHLYSPSKVPYQANVYAMKAIGVTDILSISACGSLREDYKPGEFVVVDQFIDRTYARKKTFFDGSCVAHVSVAHPVCSRLGEMAQRAMVKLDIPHHRKGVYMAMEGPQFSTQAESLFYKNSLGCDVIGMTNMPEAKLAREAEICYASIAMVTDFDCWHPDHDSVEVTDIIKTLVANASAGKAMVKKVMEAMEFGRELCPHGCDRALEYAIISNPDHIPAPEKERLGIIAKRVLEK
ncbi:S-methyl-5'-thioadenosine phosphorylase [Pseudopelagicola sp. nBUS_20]|uniref:S-methyl-5'-thioadenosine phosphorylase n=1 Tax=Pseudopelagicola sp. nBUS_20 TaxID=3395317 RepID=UPI003EBF7FFC